MAIYATIGDVREALAPEGDFDDPATAASLGTSQITDSLVEASSEIDSMVRGAPFAADSIPAIIQAIARDVAAYLATLTHRKGLELPPEHPVALRYKRAEALLAAAAKGTLDLSGDTEAEGSEASVVNAYEGDLFSLDQLSIGTDGRVLPPWLGGVWP